MVLFAHALLLVNGRYVLQLRDDKPGISSPGMWSLFGGRVEEGEEPREAIIREVDEELGLRPLTYRYLWSIEHYSRFAGTMALYSFFEADLTTLWRQQHLMEGQVVGHFSFEELSMLNIPPFMCGILERHYHECILPRTSGSSKDSLE